MIIEIGWEYYLKTNPAALSEAILQIMSGNGWVLQKTSPNRMEFRTSQYKKIGHKHCGLRNFHVSLFWSHAPQNLYVGVEWKVPIGARSKDTLDSLWQDAHKYRDWLVNALVEYDEIWIEKELPEGEERDPIFVKTPLR